MSVKTMVVNNNSLIHVYVGVKPLVGRQYSTRSSATRAINKFWRKNKSLFNFKQNSLWVNRIDDGCFEIDGNIEV